MLYLHHQCCKEMILFLRGMYLIFSCSTTNHVYFSIIKKAMFFYYNSCLNCWTNVNIKSSVTALYVLKVCILDISSYHWHLSLENIYIKSFFKLPQHRYQSIPLLQLNDCHLDLKHQRAIYSCSSTVHSKVIIMSLI